MQWSTRPGYGPGTELLGDLTGTRVIELGCGDGDNLACAAATGTTIAVGVDIAVGRIAQARSRWGHLPGLTWRTGDAATLLAGTGDRFDVCFSVFGAFWYSDPDLLLPVVADRIQPGGILAIATGRPRPGQRPGRRVDNLTLPDGQRLPVIQYAFPLTTWIQHLNRSGFIADFAAELTPPGGQTSLLLRALRRTTPGSGSAG